jgi:hypothetical protein
MNTTISPLRRITVTLALTGAAAFSAVAVAPSAFADDSTGGQTSVTAPAVTDPAVVTPPVVTPPVVAPPAVVMDKNGKPVKAPKYCKDQDFADQAKKIADAKKKVAPLFALATSSHKAAIAVRAQEVKMTLKQVATAEAVANALDMLGDKFAAQAQASIDKATVLDCFIVAGPDDRF